MAKYKVSFRGFAYVEAETEEEAEECFEDAAIYSEQEIVAVEEVDEFVIYL